MSSEEFSDANLESPNATKSQHSYAETLEKLVQAVIKGNIFEVEEILKHPKIDDFIDAGTDEENLPLYKAIENGRKRIIHLILAKCPKLLNTKYGTPPLHNAVALDKVEIAQLLFSKGARINQNNDGGTPLHYAAMYSSSEEMFKFLIENKAEINSRKAPDKWTPLHYAVQFENVLMLKLLIQTPGIKLNLGNEDGKTPLQIAKDNDNAEIIELLLNAGASTVAENSPEKIISSSQKNISPKNSRKNTSTYSTATQSLLKPPSSYPHAKRSLEFPQTGLSAKNEKKPTDTKNLSNKFTYKKSVVNNFLSFSCPDTSENYVYNNTSRPKANLEKIQPKEESSRTTTTNTISPSNASN